MEEIVAVVLPKYYKCKNIVRCIVSQFKELKYISSSYSWNKMLIVI